MFLVPKQDFAWAHRGVEIKEYKEGVGFETEDADLIEVAIREEWAIEGKAPSKADQKKALTKKIKDLEEALGKADESSEAAIESQLAAAQAELATLN